MSALAAGSWVRLPATRVPVPNRPEASVDGCPTTAVRAEALRAAAITSTPGGSTPRTVGARRAQPPRVTTTQPLTARAPTDDPTARLPRLPWSTVYT